jgi:hypothetical protein
MATGRDDVRKLVKGDKTPPVGEPTSAGQRRGGTGSGGGLPENPEARTSEDFGPGGSGGAEAEGGRTGSQMRSPGGRTRGGARTGG